MTNLLAAFTAVTLYLGCTVLLMMKLRQSAKVASLNKQMILVPGFLGLGAHLYTLAMSMMSPIGIKIGFFTALSLVSAFVTLFTLVSAIRHPIEILGIVVMPVAAFAMAADIAPESVRLLSMVELLDRMPYPDGRKRSPIMSERIKGDGTLSVATRQNTCKCLTEGRMVASEEMEIMGYHPMSGRALDGHTGAEGLPELEPKEPIHLKVHGPDCETGLFCDIRDTIPTCKDTAKDNPPECVDCDDNDGDTYTDYAGLDGIYGNADDDVGCASFSDDFELPGETPGEIPEFSTIGSLLASVIAGLGIAFVVKKK